jgi:hypothetical protein
MCFFKRKKKPEIVSRYHEGDMVYFRFRGERAFGYVYAIKQDEQGKVLYDIQIGGQCPAILKDIPEEGVSSH